MDQSSPNSVASVPSVNSVLIPEPSTNQPGLGFAESNILATLHNAQSSALSPQSFPLRRDNGDIRPGEVCLANEARFTVAYFSEALTQYAVGWKDNNNIEETLDFLFPPVQVARRFEFRKADNAESFLSETDDLRAIGSDFKRVEYKGVSANEKTHNKGLTMRVDLDTVSEMPMWREIFTQRLLQRILRNELRRAVTIASDAAANTARTWDSTAGKDPDQDILTELTTATDSSGVRPNRILYGVVAWNKRVLSHRAQSTAGGYASAAMTPEQLAAWLAVDAIRISRERYQSTATTKAKVTPDIVLSFYAEEGVGPDDPTNFKRFWTPCEGGGKYRVYEQQVSAKLIDLTVEHYSNCVLTSSVGVRKSTIS